MNSSVQRVLFWTPRVLCMLLAAFLALFAMDVFDEAVGVWQTMLTLLIHLAPTTFLVIAVLVISWKHEWIGAVVYVGLGIAYAIMAWHRFPEAVLILSGASCFIGLLLAENAIMKRRARKNGGMSAV